MHVDSNLYEHEMYGFICNHYFNRLYDSKGSLGYTILLPVKNIIVVNQKFSMGNKRIFKIIIKKQRALYFA